jgi:hypothetical protein
MAAFADDVVFEFYGEEAGLPGMTGEAPGKAAVERIIKKLIDNFRYRGWKEETFVVEGEKAALHGRANMIRLRTPRRSARVHSVIVTYEGEEGKTDLGPVLRHLKFKHQLSRGILSWPPCLMQNPLHRSGRRTQPE